jgi:hypothetical protein
VTDRLIHIRWEEPEVGGVIQKPGVLAMKDEGICVALCIFDGQLEVHLVAPTTEDYEYVLLSVLHELFYVGNDVEVIIPDLHELTFVEFVGKYIRLNGINRTRGY